MHAIPDQTLLLIVAFPLASAIIIGLFGNKLPRKLVGYLAVGSVFGSFLVAARAFFLISGAHGEDNPALVHHVYEWFSLSIGGKDVPVNVRFAMDSLSAVMTLVVTGIGGLIHVYSLGYMSEEKSYARFFAYLNLFTASMLILVLGSNVPLMFVGWEGVGLCSYLLIGFWFENRDYAAAGRKAFVANRIGDFGVLIGMFLMVTVSGSFEFDVINASAESGAFGAASSVMPFGFAVSLATATCLFLFLGCTGKSAQIPLFVWLPDAMAGPTPVSALIHAATMVTAGVYLCCRLSPLFQQSAFALGVIAVVGTLTALLAASIAVVQNEMKKILAYSTVSQLGFMFAAVGVGAFIAGFFHVFTHAFFKACLFLGAGSVMHAVHAHGDADIRRLGGLKKIMPVTHATFFVSCLAIAGMPPFSGFFSKDEILLGAASQGLHAGGWSGAVGWFTLIGLTIAATLTAFYMFRLFYLTFTGEFRSGEGAPAFEDSATYPKSDHHDHPYGDHPHESPKSMAFPLIVLGTGAVIAGWVGLPHLVPFVGMHLPNLWTEWLAPSIVHTAHDDMNAINIAAACGLGAMAIGVIAARKLYKDGASDPLKARLSDGVHLLLFEKWRVDELYALTVIGPIKKLALLAGWVDQTFVDALLTRLPSFKVRTFGRWLALLQTGAVRVYGLAVAAGLVGALWWFGMPHVNLTVHSASRDEVALQASAGLGYEYRWDANSDGQFEGGWSHNRNHTYSYAQSDTVAVVLHIHRRDSGAESTQTLTNEWELVDFPGSFQDPEGDDIAVRARVEGTVLKTIMAGNLQGVVRGADAEGATSTALQRPIVFGQYTAVALPVTRATVEVRNAFGRVQRQTLEVTLPPTGGPRVLPRRVALR